MNPHQGNKISVIYIKSKPYALDLYWRSVLDIFLFVIIGEYKNIIQDQCCDSIFMLYYNSEKSS